jgi:hypothetical protein
LISLVPGYLAYLRQPGRMLLRTAAFYDRDLHALEVLALRGVHPTVDEARSALLAVQDVPMPESRARKADCPAAMADVGQRHLRAADLRRVPLRPLRQTQRGRSCLAEGRDRGAVRARGLGDHLRVPFSFMLSMAWGCDSSTRTLGRRALTFYDTEQAAITAAKQQRRTRLTKRQILRATLLALSFAIPIAFIAYVVEDHQTASPASPPSAPSSRSRS